MVSIRITARGFGNNRKLFEDLNNNDNLERLLHKMAEDVVYDARDNIQNNQSIDAGTLLASVNILEEDPGKSVTIGATAKHAEYVEFGRGHVKPLNPDGWLHWIDKDTGKDVFSKYAGPAEPQPFLQPAVEKNSKIFSDVYAKESEYYIRKRATTLLDSELL